MHDNCDTFNLIRVACESDFLYFCRYFTKEIYGYKFIVNSHHKIIAQKLMDVFDLKTTRLIINVPPGYTKTLMTVIMFTAWCLAKNPSSRFMQLSYSDTLANESSSVTKGIVMSYPFQMMWPTPLLDDTQSKKLWYTTRRGGVYASAIGGQVTGFRAGLMDATAFSGALIVDDPLKPSDAFSVVKRTRANMVFTNTIKSRLALDRATPMVVIMQRLHKDDPTGHLLRGGMGDKWEHLCLPAEISDDDYPKDYTHGTKVNHNLPHGPLWPYKQSQDDLDNLKGDRITYSAQYLQNPTNTSDGIFKTHYWRYYTSYDENKSIVYDCDKYVTSIRFKIVTADTAQKTGQYNDYSVFQCWGKGDDGRIYLLDQFRGKVEAPELKVQFLRFCDKNDSSKVPIRKRYVEDYVSGTSLIQDINRDKGYQWIKGIRRDRDKVSRAIGVVSKVSMGLVVLPINASWTDVYIREFAEFNEMMTHDHDDQIDPTIDAIEKLLIERYVTYSDIA